MGVVKQSPRGIAGYPWSACNLQALDRRPYRIHPVVLSREGWRIASTRSLAALLQKGVMAGENHTHQDDSSEGRRGNQQPGRQAGQRQDLRESRGEGRQPCTGADRKPVRLDPRLAWFADVKAVLSPMSGVTDRAFRDVCRPFGMDLGFCEFTSASGLYHASEATWRLIDTDEEDGRVGIQIFGADPHHMGEAARLLRNRRHDVLDINFGCPAKKVVKKCGGSALLADLPLMAAIVRQVIAGSAEVPVSAKIRSGWDEASVNQVEVGQMLQELGCVWVTLHGRTRAQKFTGRANWDHIAELVAALDIPVIGNGDVVDGAGYQAMVRHTGCHAVMVGRGAIGNPWIFKEMVSAEAGCRAPRPDLDEMIEVMIDHIRREVACKGERTGCFQVRKHIARCFRGWPGASSLRRGIFSHETSAGMIDVLRQARVECQAGQGAA